MGHRYWIYRLMIDRSWQGRGYGAAAMQIVLDRLAADPACPNVLIGYEPENQVAQKLYQRLGFTPFATAPWGELVLYRSTPAASQS